MLAVPSQKLRYATVVVLGFGIDFAVTLALRQGLGLRLELAAAAGFVTALCLNYVLFELWAFRQDRARVSGKRFTGTALSAVLALACRLSVIWAIQRLIGGEGLARTVIAMLAGASASLTMNYLLLAAIFAKRDAPAAPPH